MRWFTTVVFMVVGAILSIPQNGIASEFVVYSVYRGLDLGGSEEPPQKDYFINMGAAHGIHKGTILQISRRVPTYDLSNQRLYRDVIFPIALVKVIHVDPMASIARLEKMLPTDQTPVISPRVIMVGDLAQKMEDRRIASAPAPAENVTLNDPVPLPVHSPVNSDDHFTSGDSDSGTALGLQTLHFASNSFELDPENKKISEANAKLLTKILKEKQNLKIQIEGHTDPRGGSHYNMALAEKRAKAARKDLVEQGISSDRMTTVSYGKDRLIDPGTSKEAYAKNRRDNFVATSP